MRIVAGVVVAGVVASGASPEALADDYRQSRDDAWWTGPIVAAGANTLPPGHFLVEPYVFDATGQGRYDNHWKRHASPHTDSIGSLTYMLYGLADNLTVGVIPKFGYTAASDGAALVIDSAGATFTPVVAINMVF